MKEEAKGGFVVGGVLSGGQTTVQSLGTVIKAPAGKNVPLQQNIDNAAQQRYTEIIEEMNGGTENGIRATGLQQNDAGRSAEANRDGLPGIYQHSNSEDSGQRGSGKVPVGTGFVLISENARKRLNERGVVVVEARDASRDKAAFSSALESARENNPENGWAVTPKSEEELEQSGARLLMDERGSAGLAVAPDGDIEAVFANHAAGAPKGATKSLIPIAIANGGTKLDCYGEDLVSLYAQYGFTPVARTKFDPQYANPGWDPSKGTPDIYFLMHNGDNADTVVEKIGSYPVPTAEQLNALPEMDYDSAYAYRDRLLAERSSKGGRVKAPLKGELPPEAAEGFVEAAIAAETTANTDSAAAARQQQYQTEIADALRDGDYQQALKLFKEFGNPNLRALNEVQTLKAFGDYAAAMGYDVSLEDISTDETLVAFEESYRNAIEKQTKSDIMTSTDELPDRILTRRKVSDSGREIIDKATYHKLTNPVIKRGCEIKFADEEWMRYLEKNDATAVIYDDVIIFRPDPTITEVLEEVYHFFQNRAGLNEEYPVKQRKIMNEIDAHEYLIRVADKYKIPQIQRKETKANLESYKTQMDNLKKAGEWID